MEKAKPKWDMTKQLVSNESNVREFCKKQFEEADLTNRRRFSMHDVSKPDTLDLNTLKARRNSFLPQINEELRKQKEKREERRSPENYRVRDTFTEWRDQALARRSVAKMI